MATSAKRRSAKPVTPSADGAATSIPKQSAVVTDVDIARHAYALYVARDCDPGHALDDWLQAELELGKAARSPDAD